MATVNDLIKTASARGYRVSVTLDRRGEFPGGPVELTFTRGIRHHVRLLTMPTAPFIRPSRLAAVDDYVITHVTVDDAHNIVAGSSRDARHLWSLIRSRALDAAPRNCAAEQVAPHANRPHTLRPRFSGRRATLRSGRAHAETKAEPARTRPHRFGGMHADYNFTRTAAAA